MPVKRKNGTVDWYFRRKGNPLVRLPNLPHDHPDFLVAYAAAAKSAPVRSKANVGTIAALIEDLLGSKRYGSLSKVYRTTLRRHLDAIKKQAGKAPARQLRERHIRVDVERCSNPTARLKTWRLLCDFGMAAGHLDQNPARFVDGPKKKPTLGFPPWTYAEIQTFRTHWKIGTSKRAAFELLYWTGLRIGDAVKIGPGKVDHRGVLVHAQSKVKKPAYIPWTAQLPDRLLPYETDRQQMHEALRAFDTNHMTFLATEYGSARSEKGLGNMIRAAAREAGIEKSAHGLRKSRGIALAEAGLSAHGIMSWLGHQTLKEAQHYTEEADRWRAVIGTNEEQKLQPVFNYVATPEIK
jgi:site-specific recombinase XerD